MLFISTVFGNYIIHENIHEAPNNLPCIVEAFLNTPEEEIHSFSLLYRSKGSSEYIEASMMPSGHLKYSSEIPGNFMVRDQVEYYLLLELAYGKKITFPQWDAIRNPMIIQIDLPIETKIPITPSEIENFDIVGLSPDIMIISPQPGARVRNRDLFIALSYFGVKDVDPTTVRVYLDSLDVTNRADIDSTYLSVPSASLTPGIHIVTINITNKFGQKFNDISWSFTVLPSNLTGVGLIRTQSGSIWANYTSGIVDNSAMNISELNLLYEVDLDWLQCTSQYTKSSLENKYNQPRDRFVIDLKNKLMHIKLGDSYPSIDQYALNGHHVRGVNFNFNTGPFSIDIIKGNTARGINGDPLNGAISITEIDSTTNNWIIALSRDKYTFQQEFLGGKIGVQLSDRFYWEVNYIRVQDNISTVSRELDNAIVTIPLEVNSKINTNYINEYFYNNDGIYSIRYDSLINNDNYKILFLEVNAITGDTITTVDSISFPTKNWVGTKPRDNLIYGSTMKFGFDASRVQVHSGFSISFINPDKWKNLKTISALDTMAINGADIIKILNMSNLNRYLKLQLRYLGNRVELGSVRNGSDYYSILNPYLKTDYTEKFISDRINLFQNKLFLYYKRSNITKGLYPEQKARMDIQRSIFKIALYPGIGLPTFNIGFITSDYTDTMDTRTDLVNKQINISMTDHFNLGVPQILNVNLLLYDQEDIMLKESVNSAANLSKDVSSESYGMSLTSVYNNYWESSVYYNASYYDYGQKSHVYYKEQNIHNFQLDMAYRPSRYLNRVNCGLRYSILRGSSHMTQYDFKIGIKSGLIKNFIINLNFDYRFKIMHTENKGTSDSFIRVYLSYNIL